MRGKAVLQHHVDRFRRSSLSDDVNTRHIFIIYWKCDAENLQLPAKMDQSENTEKIRTHREETTDAADDG